MSVTLDDFCAAMQRIAPMELAMEFDNPGLIVGMLRKDIRKVLVALDCTCEVASEAVEGGYDMVLTHHPKLFSPVKRLLPEDPELAPLFTLIKHDIGLYAAHTNLDAAPDGVNDCLARTLELSDITPLPPDMLGRIGTYAPGGNIGEFARHTAHALKTCIRVTDAGVPVSRVALVGGAGGDDILAAFEAGADTFVTGEAKHHQALNAKQLGINLIVAGHFETERIVLIPLIKRLQRETNDVQYNLTRFDTPILTTVTY